MVTITEKEVITDNFLLLYLINTVHEKSRHYLGMTKLQKLVFIIEKILNEKGIKTFNYNFFAWNYGSLSKEIYLDHEKLVENDIINDNKNITLSKRGKKLLEDSKSILKRNRDILKDLDKIVEEFADFDTNSLVDYVHELTVNIESHENPVKISSLNKGTDIPLKVDDRHGIKVFEIDESWIETLEILMDKEFCEDIKESEMDAVKGRVFQLQEVL
ncbi:MAG: DUF4065 domain-containing protein [Candidatus Methanofastidiosia archaeon]|jgi:uncharacterized phage-associated protein